MFSKIMTRLRNLSVHWLFVGANYSLRIAQQGHWWNMAVQMALRSGSPTKLPRSF